MLDFLLAPLTNMQTLLASSVNFQTITGAVDAAAAAEFVKFTLYDPDDDPRPRWLLGWEEGLNWEERAKQTYRMEGPLIAMLEIDTPAEHLGNNHTGMLWFLGQLQPLVNDMLTTAGTDDYIQVPNLEMTNPPIPVLPEFDDERPFWTVAFRVDLKG